ncbi:hypothetical protein ACFU6S_09880 [Streptomyces sp. NPDC057456]|uniref:hypothetical protein n=1 Tax=Streptomyces sp. NPDC057456 TaxID=3346139 RepID=UPI00367C513B
MSTDRGARAIRSSWFSARCRTTDQLEAARHLTDLTLGDAVRVNLDHVRHGIGSQPCGPGPLPRHFLNAEPVGFSFFSFVFLLLRVLGDRLID